MSNLLLLGAGGKSGSAGASIAGMFTGGYVGDWFDISDKSKMWVTSPTTTQVANDGDSIGQLRGQINSLDFIQATAGLKPTWHTGDFATFDAGRRLQRVAAGGLGLYASGSATIVAVVKANPAVTGALFSEGSTSDNNPEYCPLCSDTVTPSILTAQIRGDDSVIQRNIATDIQAGVWDNTMKVVAMVDNGSTLTPYVNNVAGTPAGYTRSGALTPTGSGIGYLVHGSAIEAFIMDLAQLFVINRALSLAELNFVCTTLGAKQGLTI